MTTADKVTVAIVLVTWLVAVGMVGEYNRRVGTLFRALAKHFPDYYKKLGRPQYSSFNIVRVHPGNYYRENLVFNGIPDDFPKNKTLRRHAEQLRKFGIKAYLAAAFFGVIMILLLMFKSKTGL